MITISESNGPHANRPIGEANDLDAAIAWAHANLPIAFLERDEDYANCADALTTDGRVITIQPRDFRLA